MHRSQDPIGTEQLVLGGVYPVEKLASDPAPQMSQVKVILGEAVKQHLDKWSEIAGGRRCIALWSDRSLKAKAIRCCQKGAP